MGESPGITWLLPGAPPASAGLPNASRAYGAANPAFSPEVVRRLRSFLQAADLVKFATYQPDDGAIGDSTRTARDYIEKDAQEKESAAPAANGKQ